MTREVAARRAALTRHRSPHRVLKQLSYSYSAEVSMVSSPVRVLVVGGGAAGAITAVAVLRQAAAYPERPVQVMVVERSAVVGPGLAYGTQESHHLLNNYASRMSAVEDDPQHLVRWCLERGMRITPGTFLARRTYGRYLADLLDNEPIPIGSGLTRQQGEVVDIVDTGTTYRATTASGAVLSADVVVLALGNPPPRMPRSVAVDEPRLLPDPWSPDLLDRVGDGDRVLLVGPASPRSTSPPRSPARGRRP